MSIYSGSSPFSRGKLGAARGMSAKTSRGREKRKLVRIASRRTSNREQWTGSTSAGGKGVTFNFVGVPSGQDKYMKSHQSPALTALTGLGTYDGLGLHAATGKAHLYFNMRMGTAVNGYDNGGAANALSLLKNVKITLALDGVEHTGYLGTASSGVAWKIEFPTIFAEVGGGGTINYFRFEYS